MFSEEILQEIDITLDKLIENATLMKTTSLKKEEMENFQKTQNSLLETLLHLNTLLEEKSKTLKIQNLDQRKQSFAQKLKQFQNLNSHFIKNASEKLRLIKKGKRKIS